MAGAKKAKYVSNVEHPRFITDYFESLQELAGITEVNLRSAVIEFEAKDEYELRGLVRETEEKIVSQFHEIEFSIPRPKKVQT